MWHGHLKHGHLKCGNVFAAVLILLSTATPAVQRGETKCQVGKRTEQELADLWNQTLLMWGTWIGRRQRDSLLSWRPTKVCSSLVFDPLLFQDLEHLHGFKLNCTSIIHCMHISFFWILNKPKGSTSSVLTFGKCGESTGWRGQSQSSASAAARR